MAYRKIERIVWNCRDFDDHTHVERKTLHVGAFATVRHGIMHRPYRVMWVLHTQTVAFLWPWAKEGGPMPHFRFSGIQITKRADGKWWQTGCSMPCDNPIQLGDGIWSD